MGKVTQHLSREDWILAGFRALTAGGAGALRVEAVARHLGTTKGSFYWHFADPADWRESMLDYWEDVAFRQIIAALEPLAPGLPRLQTLVQIATTMNHDPSHGGAAAEPALREWARYAPDVAKVVRRVDAGRTAYVKDCLQDAALDDHEAIWQARLVYAALLGLQILPASPENDAQTLAKLIELLMAAKGK
jgi:AcrR family transcriptional regulator